MGNLSICFNYVFYYVFITLIKLAIYRQNPNNIPSFFFRQFINEESLSSRYDVYLEVNYRELFATSYRRSMRYTTQDLLGR